MADELPHVEAPAGWTLGQLLAVGGSSLVFELLGESPAVLKYARWRARDMRARFAIEAEVLRTVGPPVTPRLVTHGAADGRPYLVMERVAGDTLATWMSRTGARGGLGEIVALLVRIADVIRALHDAQYVHRDLKPENICITGRGARLLDFGLAKRLGHAPSELTQAGVVGTAHYMAPEQLRLSALVDHRADIYAFGVIAFEMLAGRPPFIGERRAIEYQHQVARPPAVRETRDIPPDLDELVSRCLAKQPDARPASTRALHDALVRVLNAPGTIRGVGGVAPAPARPVAGRQTEVALAWIVGGDPLSITRAIAAVNGVVARQRGDGILAAFTATLHDPPVAVALEMCRGLVRDRCRVVLHATTALLRRTAGGKPSVYGYDLEHVDAWCPPGPFSGILFTPAAAAHVRGAEPAEVARFFREPASTGPTTDVDRPPSLVGRATLIAHAVSALGRPSLVGVSGEPGAGKGRVLGAIAERLRAAGREAIHVRARRRFLGDLADDASVVQALGATRDPRTALRAAAHRNAVLLVDDADLLSRPFQRTLLEAPIARVLASAAPLVEGSVDGTRIAIALPRLSHEEAGALLREQLRPARLVPDVLVERIALRGTGNPRILLALARDMKRRGALRRHAGSDEWYVAVDELDTLLAPPSASWLATRVLDDLPHEIIPVLRFACALGPQFCAAEVAHVTGTAQAEERLAYLVREDLVRERDGWYELADHALGEAVYHHLLDERALVHARALAYWLAQRSDGHRWTARIAFHALGAGDRETAVATSLALAEAATRRAEPEEAARLVAQARLAVASAVPDAVRDAMDYLVRR